MQEGQGQGLSQRFLGEQGGVPTVTLLNTEIPVHNHFVQAVIDPGEVNAPSPAVALARSTNANAYQDNTSANLVQIAFQAITPTGGSLPHNNMQPYLTLNFCIALQGIFPQRP
jgi:microcystin-dependent protein